VNYLSQYQKNTWIYRFVFSLICLTVVLFGTQAYADNKAKEKRAFELYDQINSTDVILGDLALDRGKHPLVKSYAIDRNYREIKEKARKIALAEGLWESAEGYPEIVPACLADIQGLKTIPIESFDESFIRHELGYISYAVGTINNDIMPNVSNTEVKELLNDHLDRLKVHEKKVRRAMNNLTNKE